jgi:NADH-quinone oxidoreductase subunit E
LKEGGFVAENFQIEINAVLDKYSNPEESLIAILQEVQDICGYISKEAVEYITAKTLIPSSRIMGVASFYAGFRLKPVGKYRIMVCMGTACHVNGSERIGDTVKRVLGIEAGDVTDDGLFSWEEVACLGCCSISPAMMINDTVYGTLTQQKVIDIIENIKKGEGK